MCYGFHPYAGWVSHWGPPVGMNAPMPPGWGYPFGAIPPMNYPPPEGCGMPWMSPFSPSIPPEQEIEFLRNQAQMLKQQIDHIDARIKELEKSVRS